MGHIAKENAMLKEKLQEAESNAAKDRADKVYLTQRVREMEEENFRLLKLVEELKKNQK